MTAIIQSNVIFENAFFTIEHAKNCYIPGYLIVFAKPPATHLAELTSETQQQLVALLAKTTQIVKQIVKPERIYTLSFGEETRQLHFHIFPRTKQMLDDYNNEHHIQLVIANGAEMFNWARKKYTTPTEYYYSTIEKIIVEFN